MNKPIRKQGVAVQLAETLRQSILAGDLSPGDPLPSERDLASRFDINRSSVREAVLRLEAWGLVAVSQGEPTKVVDVYHEGGWQMLPHLLIEQPDGLLLADVLSIRAMFLRWTTQQAALRHHGPFPKLREVLSKLRLAESVEEVLRLDWRFFEVLVETANNRVLALCTNWLRDVYLENPEPMFVLYSPLPFDVSLHTAALDAIEQGDVALAAKAMEDYALRPLGGSYVVR